MRLHCVSGSLPGSCSCVHALRLKVHVLAGGAALLRAQQPGAAAQPRGPPLVCCILTSPQRLPCSAPKLPSVHAGTETALAA